MLTWLEDARGVGMKLNIQSGLSNFLLETCKVKSSKEKLRNKQTQVCGAMRPNRGAAGAAGRAEPPGAWKPGGQGTGWSVTAVFKP